LAILAELINPPKLRIIHAPISQNIATGSALSLRCEAFGSPIPTIFWKKNREHVSQQKGERVANNVETVANYGLKTYQEGGTTAILQIPAASMNESGIVTYTCVARNGFKKVEAQAMINVFKGNQ